MRDCRGKIMNINLEKILTIVIGCLAIFLIIKNFYNLFVVYKKHPNDEQNFLFTVEKLRPLIFVKFFANCLTMPFLSQYILSLAHNSGVSAHIASMAYVTYTIFFVLTLVPGGRLVEVKNVKIVLLLMLLAEAVAFGALGVINNFWLIFAVQAFFGIIIPVSSSAEYAYIFHFSNEKNRAYALALYANTIKGAAIAGIFIGGILLHKMSMHSVFLVTVFLLICCILYGYLFLPEFTSKPSGGKTERTLRVLYKNFSAILKDADFLFSSLLAAFPLGLISDGLILFALPILLVKQHISYSIIADIMVLFSLGFFVSNKFIAKKIDQNGLEKKIIIFGLCGAALIIILMRYFGLPFLICGLFILGMLNGCMLSTSIAVASKSNISKLIGKNTALSVYRLFDFFGRIIGPMVISFLLF